MIGVRLNALLDQEALDRGLAEQLGELRQLSIKASDEIRRAIFALTSPDRIGSDFIDYMRWMLADLQRNSGIRTHLSVSGVPNPEQVGAYDVVRAAFDEAISNVRKHADARMVLVSVRFEPARVDLVVQDDGVGVPEVVLSAIPNSHLNFGLRHIRQLVIDRGGVFKVFNGEEAGLVVKVTVPLAADDT